MSGWWVRPELPLGHFYVFAALLAVSVALRLAVSPRRRLIMGPFRFGLATALRVGVPLAGVIVVRAGFRHAFIDAGRDWWSALWLSLFWMLAFVFAANLLLRDPAAFLLADGRVAAHRSRGLEGAVRPAPRRALFLTRARR